MPPERDHLAIGRPDRLRTVLRQPPLLAPIRIHDVDVEAHRTAAPVAAAVSLSSEPALERDPPPVGRPGRSDAARPSFADSLRDLLSLPAGTVGHARVPKPLALVGSHVNRVVAF